MTTVEVKIVKGPGKFQLMESCFSGKEIFFDTEPFPREAGRMAGAKRVTAMWIGVKAEDGSGESWLIEFSNQDGHFKGYYRTASKSPSKFKGFLKLLLPEV
jgi:hypothetical protein